MPSLRFPIVLSALTALLVGCAPTLHVTKNLPPLVDPAVFRVVATDVKANIRRQTESSVMAAVLVGQVNVPLDPEKDVREAFARHLPLVNVRVCPGFPCPEADATVNAFVTESVVGPETQKNGSVVMRARLVVNVDVVARDGRRLASRVLSSRRSTTNLFQAGDLMPQCADGVAGELTKNFLPRRYTRELTLEDGGPLDPGVNKLLTGNAQGAQRDFEAIVAANPNDAKGWYDLGVAGEVQGDWALAVKGYRGAAERNRKDLYFSALSRAEEELQAQGGGR